MTTDNALANVPAQSPPAPADLIAQQDGDGASTSPDPTLQAPGLFAPSAESGPGQMPPPLAAAAGDDTGVTATWHSNVKVDALWSIEETRNAWLRIAGGPWKKIYSGRDGSFQALVTLASQARQTQRTVSMREEAGGVIHEIYLW